MLRYSIPLMMHTALVSVPSPAVFVPYWHHRDLHSFPTRRSSDLRAKAVEDSEATERCNGEDSASAVGAAGTGTVLDRKSTRLNSSHRCISYAVFCLKKKIKMGKRRQLLMDNNVSWRQSVSHRHRT